MIDLKQAIDYMLSNGYVAFVNGELVITNKLKREFVANADLLTKKEVWDKFIQDADIPHRVSGSDGKFYTIRQYSPKVGNLLLAAIKACDYDVLVESTKRYYKSTGYKLVLSNYFERRVWVEEYNRYMKEKKDGTLTRYIQSSSGGNPFED